jgi:hypothetical protein
MQLKYFPIKFMSINILTEAYLKLIFTLDHQFIYYFYFY